MQVLRSEVLHPSGVEHAVSLKLIPTTVNRRQPQDAENISPRAICNLVVARSNLLRVYEVVEEQAAFQFSKQSEKDGQTRSRKDTEAVEGEVEMDAQGEGFVNMGSVKSAPSPSSTSTLKLYFVREHLVHGIVTGLQAVKSIASDNFSLDRLLVSFEDAKLALLEWSVATHDLGTISIHTYERAHQMASFDPASFRASLKVDPNSRCATLLLSRDALAVLPFYQSQADLDVIDMETSVGRETPYSPSYVLDLREDVDSRIRNVVDYAFLPGFNNPTIAVLFQSEQTWTGRLKEYKDTCCLHVFTLDLVTRKCPIIISAESLPHDCFSIVPCEGSMRGIVILSCNALIYVDPGSRKTILPVNGWASRITDTSLQPLRPDEQDRDLHLECSYAVFADERTFFVITRDGHVYPVEIVMDGRIVSRLSLGSAMSQTTIPSMIHKLNFADAGSSGTSDVLFIGSTVGPSVLLKISKVEEKIEVSGKTNAAPAAVADNPSAMEIDDDDDIYADVITDSRQNAHINGHVQSVETRTVVHLTLCDSLPGYGSINDMVFALVKNGDRLAAELVAATGHGHLGGFTLFQEKLPTQIKRKVHVIGGVRGIWSIPIRQSLKSSGASVRGLPNSASTTIDTVVISTDAAPSPGLTRFATRTTRNDIAISTRRTETTLGAAPFFQRTAILQVTTDLIRVLEPDFSERQCIKDMEGTTKRPKIRYCNISDPFVLIIREDDSLGLFIGDAERGRIRRKDMTPMGEKISRYTAGCFFLDKSGIFELQSNPQGVQGGPSDGKPKGVTGSIESAVDSQRGSQWLILCRPQGVVEIWTLPKLSIVFSTSVIKDIPPVLSDSFSAAALSLPEEPPRKPTEFDIDLLQVAQIGGASPQPHLIVLLRSGQMAVYQAVPQESPEWPSSGTTRASTLKLNFVKMGYRTLEPRQNEPLERSSIMAEQRRALRNLIPFVTNPTPETSLSGVFLTGDQPCWIVSTDKSSLKIHLCSSQIVNSFTACTLWNGTGEFLMHTDEGPCLIEWVPGLEVGTRMPSIHSPRPRAYTSITYEASSGLIVASSLLNNPFTIFDEEGVQMWEVDAPNINYPQSEMSTLELFPSDFSCILDGYEFMPNEIVTALDCVTLETQSTESGSKEFVVVGTTINRGEDLAVKGATYVFDIAEVVPEPTKTPMRRFKLRLLCRDEAKGPVTALCGMNGYLVSSMGQKIFVRALDLDERLVGVAFLDVGVYVTSLRAIKNLLLIGDAVKSVWLVGFQEDPFKLVIIGKDIHPMSVTRADFLFMSNGQFYITAGDDEGVIRLLEYDPKDPESRSGQFLLRRSEFHTHVPSRATALVARRSHNDDGLVPQARLVCGAADGSMYALTPIDSEDAAKRLLLLQGLIIRNIQHVAGLNPRAFRIVRNDHTAKPLTRGIIDGSLFSAFEELSLPRRSEITRPIGTVPQTVLKDLAELSGPW